MAAVSSASGVTATPFRDSHGQTRLIGRAREVRVRSSVTVRCGCVHEGEGPDDDIPARKTDYTEGGHGYVYPWMPRPEIWVADGVDRRQLPFIVTHEYLERRLMRDEGMGYDPAHEVCSKVEFDLRKRGEVKQFLAPGRRKVGKEDLPRLTLQALFDFVVKKYVKE